MEWNFLLHKGKEVVDDHRVVFDEKAVKVAETEEGLKFLQGPRSRPFCDTGKFGRVHVDLGFGNNDT